MDDFKENINKNFDFLLLSGFTSFNLDAKDVFRNFMVILEKNNVRLRFVQDRADFVLYIGSTKDPKVWHDFYKIMWWLKSNSYIGEFKASNKLNIVKNDLKKYLELIQKLFCDDNYWSTKDAIANNHKVQFLIDLKNSKDKH